MIASKQPAVLVIDHDSDARDKLGLMLKERGLLVDIFSGFREASLAIRRNKYDVIITNMHTEISEAGLDVLNWSSIITPSTRVIITSDSEDYRDAFLAGELGMFAYIPKCKNSCYDEIMQRVEDALVFDAFLSYKKEDQDAVQHLYQNLSDNGLRIWVDYERIFGGANWVEAIQDVIPSCRSALLVFGSHEVGQWQKVEIETLLQFSNEANKPIIPLLLPGVNDLPPKFPFLKRYHYLKLNKCLYSGCVCEQLVSAILGQHRRYRRFGQRP